MEMALLIFSFILFACAFVHAGGSDPKTASPVLLDSMAENSILPEPEAQSTSHEDSFAIQKELAEMRTKQNNPYLRAVPLGVAMLVAFILIIIRSLYLNYKLEKMHCENGICYRTSEE